MARSMTGFGQAELSTAQISCSCQIKSVNSRYLQLSVHVEPPDDEMEITIRRLLQEPATRGSIDVSIRAHRSSGTSRLAIDHAALDALRPLALDHGVTLTLDGLTRSGVVRFLEGAASKTEEDVQAVLTCLRQALEAWNRSRELEGAALARDMLHILEDIQRTRATIIEADQGRTERALERLRARMVQLLHGHGYNEDRLLEEAAYQAQRADITEEIDRIGIHVGALRGVLEGSGDSAAGKRIEFLIQEMQREFNTLGSKAQEARVGALAVEAKVMLEKLRQQAANVE